MKVKRAEKSQSWVSSLMLHPEDDFGISYRNLSHSRRQRSFCLFVFFSFCIFVLFFFLRDTFTYTICLQDRQYPTCQILTRRPAIEKKPVKTNFVFT